MAPALRAFRTELQESLKSGSRGSTQGRGEQRTRSVLVTCEVALALVLLVGAGLMLRKFEHLQAVDPGFDPSHVLTLEAAAGGTSYPSAAERIRFFEQLRPRLESLPGAQSVSLINHLPIGGDLWTLGIAIEGRPIPAPGQQSGAVYRVVQPGYFGTMKIPMLRGRDFTAHDAMGTTPVVIVNEALARIHWPGEDPVGRRIRLSDRTWMTIVGVVKNVKQNDWIANPGSEIYLPHAQGAETGGSMSVVIRAHGNPLTLAKGAEDAFHSIDKNVPVAHVMTMEQVIGDKLWRGRLAMTLLMLFAGIAITLAALGIYGAISYSVAQRTNEIGIRMALGARRMDVLRMVLRQALAVVASGISIGLFGAWMLTRALGGLLYGVTATDPVTFFAVPVLVVGLSAVACSLPALRAARVDPVTALRYE